MVIGLGGAPPQVSASVGFLIFRNTDAAHSEFFAKNRISTVHFTVFPPYFSISDARLI